MKFRLDKDAVPVEVYVKERKEAHMMIEDFMLLANREVAQFISLKGRDQEIPYVYRIHDEPDPDKVMELSRFAREMGFDMNFAAIKLKQAHGEHVCKVLLYLADQVCALRLSLWR